MVFEWDEVRNRDIIVVVHTERGGRMRLISARPASRKERQFWHEQIQAAPDAG